MSNELLNAKYITKTYTMGDSQLNVLNGLNFSLVAGEIVAIVGESGAGKSTLLHILGLLDRPTTGQLYYKDTNLSSLSDDKLATFRNNEIGFIFQFHHLLSEFTALENVVMPAMIAKKNNQESIERAKLLLDRVGLSKRLDHRPNELSGGELQRVAVARALINEPSLILADEPSGNLDHRNSEMLHELIWKLAREQNFTFVIVTHDLHLARNADRTLLLSEGNIQETDLEKFQEHTML